MKQQEISFFWPLTEQIPLDLDYPPNQPPKVLVKNDTAYTFYPTTTGNITIQGADICLDVETTTVKLKSSPHLLRRLVYNILGIKWKIK
jgi:hypothetical protein